MKRFIFIMFGLLVAALTPGSARAERQKLALLVGVSNYQQIGTNYWRTLHTEKDIAQIQKVLTEHYGFQPADLRVLQNEKAAGKDIRQAFKEHLIDKVRPGAVVVFHFSGHGQQIPDDNGDELDGMDESLVPYDTVDQAAEVAAKTNLRDDEIGSWLLALRKKMTVGGKFSGSINVFLDTCYSGSATRGALVERGAIVPTLVSGPPRKPVATGKLKGAVGLLSAEEVQRGTVLLLSATRNNQTAKEVDGMGVFSQALVHALERAEPGMTMRGVYDRVVDEVSGKAVLQDPSFEGPIDTLVLSDTAVPQPQYLRVAVHPTDPQQLLLPAGEVHGVTIGSVYTLYRAGSGPLINPLGQAVIDSLQPFTSTAKLKQSIDKSLLGAARASETTHAFSEHKLRVHLDLAEQPAVEQALRELSYVEPGTASDYQVQIGYNKPNNMLLFRRARAEAAVAVPMDAKAPEVLERHLRGEWRWQHLAGLTSDNKKLNVEITLQPVTAVINPSGKVDHQPTDRTDVKAGHDVTLGQGDLFQLVVHNLAKVPLFVTIFELNPAGEIKVSFPDAQQPDDARIAPGTQRLSFDPYVYLIDNPLGRTRFKAIVTRDAVDFGSLISRGASRSADDRAALARSAAPATLGGLPELLMDAVATQGLARTTTIGGGTQNSWGTADAWLTVTAKPAAPGKK